MSFFNLFVRTPGTNKKETCEVDSSASFDEAKDALCESFGCDPKKHKLAIIPAGSSKFCAAGLVNDGDELILVEKGSSVRIFGKR